MADLLTTKLAAVRAEILRVLQTAAGTGVPVYDYLRNLTHQQTLEAVATETRGKLHFWMFGLASDQPFSGKRYAAGETRVRLQWDLHGYFGLVDASATEKTFDAEVAAVFDAFELPGNKKLSTGGDVNALPTTIEAGPAQRVQGGAITIGSHLCHYARLSLLTVLSLEC